MEEDLEEQERDIWKKILVPLHPLNYIEITNYFKYEPRFIGVFSRNNLPRIKNGGYVTNVDDKKSKVTHWVSLSVDISIICGFYCIDFIEYMLAGKTLLDYTNLFSPNAYKKNDKIIYKYFKDKYGRIKKSRT